MPEVKDAENDQLNVLKIIVEHHVDEHVIEDDTLVGLKLIILFIKKF